MNNRKIRGLYYISQLFLITACIEPYNPPATNQNVNVLVVDGFLDATNRTVNVILSRTLRPSSDMSYSREENAIVSLENEDLLRQPLQEVEPGLYSKKNLVIDFSKKYRINILTGEEEYTSDFVTVKNTSTLDEVSWEGLQEGVQVYVDAQDPTKQTRYYQWKFTETWQYTALEFSNIKVQGEDILFRNSDEMTTVCYKTLPSSQILIESTTRLSEDVVNDFPLFIIPKGSTKLATRYSVLIQQRALDVEAYTYLLELKKTTETMGGLFDPLPSQIRGNVYNVNKQFDPVIGYFMGGAVQEKRIFITNIQLPIHLRAVNSPAGFCPIDTVTKAQIFSLYPEAQILSGHPSADLNPDEFNQFIVTSQRCTDCRLSDTGTITKPAFW